VFLQSVKYRYYPIFMIVVMATSIYSKRDFGSMLVAERKCSVYQRTDGGDGKGKGDQLEGGANKPKADTPSLSYNLILPIFLMVWFCRSICVVVVDDICAPG
jgi:Na+/H+ antiporter NhaC